MQKEIVPGQKGRQNGSERLPPILEEAATEGLPLPILQKVASNITPQKAGILTKHQKKCQSKSVKNAAIKCLPPRAEGRATDAKSF